MSGIRFDERVAIVTGAGAGLGKAYAIALAERGASVIVNDLGGARDGGGADANAADSVVKEITASGGKAVANYSSVATKEGAEAIVQSALEHFGKVDILINNAGILRDKSLGKISEKDWDMVLDVHLKGSFMVSQSALRVMKERGYGRIINTTSGAGLYGNFGQVNYSSAKMGIVGLTNSIAIEGEKYNIKCNAIAPVAVSRLTEDIFPPEMIKMFKPEYIAPLVLFLASEENNVSKMLFNCAAGWFSRAEIICSPGLSIGNEDTPVTIEGIRDNWDSITSLSHAKPLAHIGEIFELIL